MWTSALEDHWHWNTLCSYWTRTSPPPPWLWTSYGRPHIVY